MSLDSSDNNPPISPPHADVPDGVFVVVPAYNEAPAIGAVLQELRAVCPNVVIVDDGSTDGTSEVARTVATSASENPLTLPSDPPFSVGSSDPPVGENEGDSPPHPALSPYAGERGLGTHSTYVLRHPINCGQGAALQTGIDFALLQGAEIIVTFDADGQHRVEDIAVLLSPILSGECDFVLGSRFLGSSVGIPPLRRKMLRLGVLFTRIVNGVKLTDAHNGLRAFSRRAAQRINLRLDRMAHATELIDQVRQSGLPFKEVPVQIRYTPYSLRKGQSTRGAIRIALHYLLGRVLL